MSSNFNDPRNPWARLTAAARTVRDDRDDTAPYGFATRIAALALAQEEKVASLFEEKVASLFDRFALRALGVSCLLALFSVALNYETLSTPASTAAPVMVAGLDEVMLPTSDAVAVVFDIAD
jgi:hypothetical protein